MRTVDGSLTMTAHPFGGYASKIQLQVTSLFNFGYAGRDSAVTLGHIQELVQLGLPAPTTVPAVFPIPPSGVTTGTEIVVAGAETYGEIEYALFLTEEFGWLVSVASDHSDFVVEKISTSRSKAICPDVVSPDCWLLSDIEDHWDLLELTCSRFSPVKEVVQAGKVSSLLAPAELIRILEGRVGRSLEVGTVVLSGTIAGEPRPGAEAWQVQLHDPQLGRVLLHEYQVVVLPDELV